MSFATRAIAGAGAAGLAAALLLAGPTQAADIASAEISAVSAGTMFPPGCGAGGLPAADAEGTMIVAAGFLVLALGAGLFRLARRRRPMA
ncbi:hypothetical protein [Catellatospora sp. NPDC049111]|jgi:hypothetical protein|uniref:hypothetical protein n=1 Tax=unclassified Catellatospora TaxID=2645785 RepID=UPI003405A8F5